jgi:hypothetical protein
MFLHCLSKMFVEIFYIQACTEILESNCVIMIYFSVYIHIYPKR